MSKLHAEMVLRARDDRMRRTLGAGAMAEAASFSTTAEEEDELEVVSAFAIEVAGGEVPRFPRSTTVGESEGMMVQSWATVTKKGADVVKVWPKPQGYQLELLNLANEDWMKVVSAYSCDQSEFLRVRISVVYSALVLGRADSKLDKEKVTAWSKKVFPVTVVEGMQPALFVPTVRPAIDYQADREEPESQVLVLLVPADVDAESLLLSISVKASQMLTHTCTGISGLI